MPRIAASKYSRRAAALAVLAALGAGFALLAAGDEGAPPGVASEPVASAVPSPAAAPAPPPPAPPSEPAPAAAPPARVAIQRPIQDLDPETRAALEARLAREFAAEQRFEQGLEASQMRSRDVDRRVRDAFQRVELEPDLVDGGWIRGLRIRTIEGGSVFDEAGFRPGDLLVSLDGTPLEDPAELPRILGSLGPRLSVCAERGGSELCRELVLR